MDKPVRVIFEAGDELEDIANGRFQPQRITSESPNSLLVLLNGADRTAGGNGCDYVINLGREIQRVRSCHVSKVLLPKLPTINRFNNSVTVVHELGTASTTIPYGFYNLVSFTNILTQQLGALFVSLGDTCTVSYDPKTRVASITSNGGNKWFFSSECTFIKYGANVHSFYGLPPSSNPTLVGSVVVYSSTMSLIYSRYVTIQSRALQAFVRNGSMDSKGRSDIIASCSIVDSYQPIDFDPSSVYTSNSITVTEPDAQVFSIGGRNYASLQYIDVHAIDEFGFPLSDVISVSPDGSVSPFNMCIWLTFTL